MPQVIDCQPSDAEPARSAVDADMLQQIARRVTEAMHAADLELDVFFLPSCTNRSYITFGTTEDGVDDALWDRVAAIVKGVVEEVLRAGPLKMRHVPYAQARRTAHATA